MYTIDIMYILYYNGGTKGMKDMITLNATDVRNDWSTVVDTVVREKPQFIKRTRDCMLLSNIKLMETLLTAYTFTAEKFIEDDGSITLSLDQIDLVENAETESEAILLLAQAIIDYSEDYYNNYNLYSVAPNRKSHIPYVFKSLIIDDVNKIGELIQCHNGKN